MNIEIQIVESRLVLSERTIPGCGAVARFEGIVRETECGQPITALRYEAYESMAIRHMLRILADLHRDHPFHLARVSHRIGVVPAEQAAIIMDVHTAPRTDAFALLSKFMDLLKKDVPIWKVNALPRL